MRQAFAAAYVPMRRPKGTAPQLLHAAIGLVGFFACYARTFVLPHTPILFWGDQMLYATNGARIVAGQMPYRDFFEFLPAGTDLAYALLFQTFGVRLWIPNLLMVVLATAALLLTTLAGESILKGPSASCRQCSVWGVQFCVSTQYRPEHITRSIQVLEERRVPLFVIRPYTQIADTPAYDAAPLQALRTYIETHYHMASQFSTGDQAWERNPDGRAGGDRLLRGH